jgi:superfamily II DNA or RNA helicase
MVNISRPELKETKAQSLPPASIEALERLRKELCFSSDFKLQTQQRFLRRILSPESPSRNLLMVHGTGTGKTCTAIQIAEEYILRPEFQDKKVLVLANPSVEENFKSEIFNVNRLDPDPSGVILSKQCTGRRYLDIIQRAQSKPIRLTDLNGKKEVRDMATKIFGEFYEFQGYRTFANYIETNRPNKTDNDYNKWIHKEFDNRLIIVDEAHNLRVDELSEDLKASKKSAETIEYITKNAKNVTLVLLTATPMYNSFDEIIFYFNLFLWNDKRLDHDKALKVSDFFNENGTFKEGQEERFRGFCQDYVSYIKGDNPFTFPFRLPPPEKLIAQPTLKLDFTGNKIKTQRKYLTLTKSIVSPFQETALRKLEKVETTTDPNLICSFPEYRSFPETFETSGEQYAYRKDVEKFLSPSKIATYSSKFAVIMNSINNSSGIVYVYSNLVMNGVIPFAMCLEEHGFSNATADNLLKNPSGEVSKGSKGKYVIFTGKSSDTDITKAILRLKSKDNANGEQIRVIVASPKVSEGVDFKFVRQIHVLDPWFNMSRIEQILGRGMRTCSHDILPFEQQNCTVYLHVCRYSKEDQETVDEYIYRVFVEQKGASIARVKRVIMESSMDCELQNAINNLPKDWRDLKIPQIRSENQEKVKFLLQDMSAPTFQDIITDLACRIDPSKEDDNYERPLSAILDIRDEVFDKLLNLFVKKPIWSSKDLYEHASLKQYSKSVLDYLVQNAIESQFKFKAKDGRSGKLQSRGGILSLTFEDEDTLIEKLVQFDKGKEIDLPVPEEKEIAVQDVNIDARREAYDWPAFAKEFDNEILNWYIIDHELSEQERINYLLNIDWLNPPIYAKPLVATMKDGKNMYILGSNRIYDENKRMFVPIGEEKDVYDKWISNTKDEFIDKKDMIFATIKEGRLVFNIDNDESLTKIQKAPRSKVVPGLSCVSYNTNQLNLISEWISGSKFPESVKTNKPRCVYLDLLIRRAILQGKEGIFWLPPQIYEIFLKQDEHRKDIVKRLK